jgi:hypothetical protein
MNPKYGVDPKSISGIILNDAAGLDMKNYLEENPPSATDNYLTTWTDILVSGSKFLPIYFLHKKYAPTSNLFGRQTYASIKKPNKFLGQ